MFFWYDCANDPSFFPFPFLKFRRLILSMYFIHKASDKMIQIFSGISSKDILSRYLLTKQKRLYDPLWALSLSLSLR